MKRFYCTFFDRNYLAKALTLIESLQRQERQPFHLYVVCLDEITRLVLEKLNVPNVTLIPIHEIERGDQALLAIKPSRTLVEYYWTITPTVILRILEQNPHVPLLTYLDADLFFFSDAQPIFDELGSNSILIHEHRFSPALAHLNNNGKYNVGLLCFRNDDNGLSALRWWRERCIEWCFHRVEDGKMGDQLYLNDWPTRFNGVKVLQNVGAGLAPWNHEQYRYTLFNEEQVRVNDTPIVFYHFHSFQFILPNVVVPAAHVAYPLTEQILRLIFLPYLQALELSIQRIRNIIPEFSFGLVQNDILTPEHTFLARHELINDIKAFQIPQTPIALNNAWDCYCSAQLKSSSAGRDTAGTEDIQLWSNNKLVQSENDLILQLQGRAITETIETVFIVGAYQFEERELIFNLFPNLKKICLFEPIPELYWALVHQTLGDVRIEVFPYALSDANGPAAFHVTSNVASSSLLELGKHREIFPQVKAQGSIVVPCLTLDSVIQKHGLTPPDMLFLDVQGAEYKVLSTLSPMLRSKIRLIYTEASKEELYVGAKGLIDLQNHLSPDYLFLGFAPLINETPTHGNSLFVRASDKDLLCLVPRSAPQNFSAPRNYH